jgi:hypothetical protein
MGEQEEIAAPKWSPKAFEKIHWVYLKPRVPCGRKKGEDLPARLLHSGAMGWVRPVPATSVRIPIPCRFPGNYQRAQHRSHGSVAFTLDIYSQVLPHMQYEAKERVQALLINAAAAQAPRRSEA